MPDRLKEISEIESARGSKVICYLTGDRTPFQTAIGEDVIPILYRHLELIGEGQELIDLFLYTRGGDMVVPIRIVNLIRNYCKRFSILIPYRCHSAGTLISMGADEIVMAKLAELTPVDPTSTNHVFNPKGVNHLGQPQTLPISVEDVSSYLFFARDVLKGQDQNLVDLYSKMSVNLHPLALGNVYRVQKMIKIIAKKLLALHFNKSDRNEDHIIKKIIKEITEDICVHNYPIYREEAKELGLTITFPKKGLEGKIWDLFQKYSDEMKLSVPFSEIEELGAQTSVVSTYSGACIESIKAEDVFNFTYQISQATPHPGVVPTFSSTKAKWEKIR